MTERIVHAIVRENAMLRHVPAVYVLDDCGLLAAWPASHAPRLPAEPVPQVDAYFADPASDRSLRAVQIEAHGQSKTVRVVPHRAAQHNRYAVIVERLVLRPA